MSKSTKTVQDYASMKVTELKALCKKRGLTSVGAKADIILILKKADKNPSKEDSEEETTVKKNVKTATKKPVKKVEESEASEEIEKPVRKTKESTKNTRQEEVVKQKIVKKTSKSDESEEAPKKTVAKKKPVKKVETESESEEAPKKTVAKKKTVKKVESESEEAPKKTVAKKKPVKKVESESEEAPKKTVAKKKPVKKVETESESEDVESEDVESEDVDSEDVDSEELPKKRDAKKPVKVEESDGSIESSEEGPKPVKKSSKKDSDDDIRREVKKAVAKSKKSVDENQEEDEKDSEPAGAEKEDEKTEEVAELSIDADAVYHLSERELWNLFKDTFGTSKETEKGFLKARASLQNVKKTSTPVVSDEKEFEVHFSEEHNAYVKDNFVYDKKTKSVVGKLRGDSIVALEDSDVQKLETSKIRNRQVTQEQLDIILQEGEDDGEAVNRVQNDVNDILDGVDEASEETFGKILKAQSSCANGDVLEVSKKSGVDESVCKDVMSRLGFYSDKYPKQLAQKVVRKTKGM